MKANMRIAGVVVAVLCAAVLTDALYPPATHRINAAQAHDARIDAAATNAYCGPELAETRVETAGI